ncbi:MAG: membrane-bound lytic murein transglycosylase MltF [Pseudomonadota bacterium]|nr:membrane-bound lytic murein transglycosylase MltF [Pseudomonadota bacterium]
MGERLALAYGVFLVFLAVTDNPLWDEGRELTLADIHRRGELVVLTRNAPTTYYQGRNGPEGFEHDLARSFADFLGVRVRFQVHDSVAGVLAAARANRGHLAAAGITRTPLREGEFLFGPDYRRVQQQLVCRRGGPQPAGLQDLTDLRIAVTPDSSYDETLSRLRELEPALDWETHRHHAVEELLEQVWTRNLDCTIADSNIVAINRRYYPELTVAFPIHEEEPLAWVVADKAKALLPALRAWQAQARSNGTLAAIEERYYGFVEIFDYVDVRVFMRRIDERLPEFRLLFEEAAARHGLPWTLLAAVGYQESHWDPAARSPTGVGGLMMLTRTTASELGVADRHDPVQSIPAAALYLRRLLHRLPASVTGDDRLWFALAAYNVGLGHIWDARKLARRLGKNPDAWMDLKTVLPLLARKRYYQSLKHGYARGTEPVAFVQRVRDFQDILERHLSRTGPQRLARAAALPATAHRQ